MCSHFVELVSLLFRGLSDEVCCCKSEERKEKKNEVDLKFVSSGGGREWQVGVGRPDARVQGLGG